MAGPPRVVYVQGLAESDRTILEARGYRPVELLTMPRVTTDDHQAYLLAKAQALEEGTIPVSAEGEDRTALELEMRAYGLLDKRTTSMNLTLQCDATEVSSLLGWGGSRHTLAGNSTALAATLPAVTKKVKHG